MKINSKLVPITVLITIGIFLSININLTKDNIYIETIQGNRSELGAITLTKEINGNSRYINSIDEMSNNNHTNKFELQNQGDMYGSKIQERLIETVSGNDDIARIGIVENSIEGKEYLVIDERKSTDIGILPSQGNDEELYIDNEEKSIDYKRTQYEIDSSQSTDTFILATYRYKNEIYVMCSTSHHSRNSNKAKFSVIKINPNTKEVKEVNKLDVDKSINQEKYNTEVYRSTYAVDTQRSSNGFNVLIYDRIDDSSKEIENIYLLEYSIHENNHSITKISTEEDLYGVKYLLSEDEIELVLTNSQFNQEVINESTKYKSYVKYINYNIKTKDKDEIYYNLESDLKNERGVNECVIDENRIFIKSNDDSFRYNDFNEHIYVLNKNSENIVFKGKTITNHSGRLSMIKEGE